MSADRRPVAVSALAARVDGDVVGPDDDGYDEARRVWNGKIDRYPGAVVRPTGVDDVVAVVRFADEHDLHLAVRGGGHNVAGSGTCDDGVVVDLSAMNAVTVDPAAMTARVGGGATWADLDAATQAFGLVVPGGVVSTTGVAGLTLGGGFGNTRRKFGLTCDSLRSVELVTAAGEVVTASEAEHTELFWALRGGGGNFGVVTSFEFDCHELGPAVMATSVMYPLDEAVTLLREWREFVRDAPDEISSTATLWSVPADPAFPREHHGTPVFLVSALYAGAVDAGQAALQPLREFATPLVDPSGPTTYTAAQSRLDRFFPAGRRYYWKSRYLESLPDDALELVVDYARRRPSPHSVVMLRNRGGAVARVDPSATAFPDRSSPFMLSVDACWEDASEDEANVAWARALWSATEPYAADAVYLNFAMGDEGDELVETTFGPKYERLVAVKRRYDSGNRFRVNRNVPPGTGDGPGRDEPA